MFKSKATRDAEYQLKVEKEKQRLLAKQEKEEQRLLAKQEAEKQRLLAMKQIQAERAEKFKADVKSLFTTGKISDEFTAKDILISGGVGLLTGGPIGLFFSPFALRAFETAGLRQEWKWIAWGATGVIAAPICLVFAGIVPHINQNSQIASTPTATPVTQTFPAPVKVAHTPARTASDSTKTTHALIKATPAPVKPAPALVKAASNPVLSAASKEAAVNWEGTVTVTGTDFQYTTHVVSIKHDDRIVSTFHNIQECEPDGKFIIPGAKFNQVWRVTFDLRTHQWSDESQTLTTCLGKPDNGEDQWIDSFKKNETTFMMENNVISAYVYDDEGKVSSLSAPFYKLNLGEQSDPD